MIQKVHHLEAYLLQYYKLIPFLHSNTLPTVSGHIFTKMKKCRVFNFQNTHFIDCSYINKFAPIATWSLNMLFSMLIFVDSCRAKDPKYGDLQATRMDLLHEHWWSYKTYIFCKYLWRFELSHFWMMSQMSTNRDTLLLNNCWKMFIS